MSIIIKKKKLNVLNSWHIYYFIVHFACLLIFLLKKNLNVLNFWHIYCFIVQMTFMFFFSFFFFFLELVSDAALMSELGMSTPTPIEVDGRRLLCALWMGGIDTF